MVATKDEDSWAFHSDFADLIAAKDSKTILRLLAAADIALAFARALVGKDYGQAHAMLSSKLKLSSPPDALRTTLEEMIQYSGEDGEWPTDVHVVTGLDASEMGKKKRGDFGWSYVAIGGPGYNEAVAVTVADEKGRLVIREIEWGRP